MRRNSQTGAKVKEPEPEQRPAVFGLKTETWTERQETEQEESQLKVRLGLRPSEGQTGGRAGRKSPD